MPSSRCLPVWSSKSWSSALSRSLTGRLRLWGRYASFGSYIPGSEILPVRLRVSSSRKALSEDQVWLEAHLGQSLRALCHSWWEQQPRTQHGRVGERTGGRHPRSVHRSRSIPARRLPPRPQSRHLNIILLFLGRLNDHGALSVNSEGSEGERGKTLEQYPCREKKTLTNHWTNQNTFSKFSLSILKQKIIHSYLWLCTGILNEVRDPQ